MTYLGRLDGYDYISLPDGVALPEQPEQIGMEQVTDSTEIERLRQGLLTFENSRRLADSEIRSKIGDTSDLMADLGKRIGMVERLVMRMAYYLLSDQEISQEVKDAYYPMVEEYINAVDAGQIEDRVDLESNVRLQQVLTQRFDRIARIVDEVHLGRVKGLLG
jgi:phage gp36-like protein